MIVRLIAKLTNKVVGRVKSLSLLRLGKVSFWTLLRVRCNVMLYTKSRLLKDFLIREPI